MKRVFGYKLTDERYQLLQEYRAEYAANGGKITQRMRNQNPFPLWRPYADELLERALRQTPNPRP